MATRLLAMTVMLLVLVGLLTSALPCLGADSIRYGAKWWPAELGSVRARITVPAGQDAVWTHIPWRRHDASPEKKGILIFDTLTGKRARNICRINVNREFADLVIQPLNPGPSSGGEYDVYYLPFSISPYPEYNQGDYRPVEEAPEQAWLEKHGLTPDKLARGEWRKLPQAPTTWIMGRSRFDRFDPMELVATSDELKAMLSNHLSDSYLLFAEDRRNPIRMTDDLPYRWAQQGPSDRFRGEAQKNEYYTFQVGVYAARAAIDDLTVKYGDLKDSKTGKVIPASAVNSINLGGNDWLGRPIKKTFAIENGKVRAMWFGIQVPQNAQPGDYTGALTIQPKGAAAKTINLAIKVTNKALADHGDSDLRRMSRLRWLDSTAGLDDEPVAPYTALKVTGQTVACLGREVTFNAFGLPKSIKSNGREVLAGSVAMVVETAKGAADLTAGRTETSRPGSGAIVRDVASSGKGFSMRCSSKMDFDGYTAYEVTIKSDQAAELKDIRLEIPVEREVAKYMLGFGRKGGLRPAEWRYSWQGQRTNTIWLGDYDAGLQCKLKGADDSWWDFGDVSQSWQNGGKGGGSVTELGDKVLLQAFSGPRSMKAGQEVGFRFSIMVTPVKPLDPDHWNQRYYHFYAPQPSLDMIQSTGAKIVNAHQGNELNPYINYPFLTTDKIKSYADEAHSKGLKLKIYYTTGQLSNHAYELWALRSLGDEIFTDGPGGGYAWLQEHLGSRYLAGWCSSARSEGDEIDQALHTVGLSRWHNYYIEGLAWLLKNVGIDGLYMDGIGYDRQIMKRVRKVMESVKPGCTFDLHCGPTAGAEFYGEHFPYLNSIWFGEGCNYDETPDYWLVEISGIPFGLFGEMLQGGGNPWRGMVYGMTNRLGWGGDPRELWGVWDEFGIKDSKMIGYWDKSCPVKTDNKDVLATAYIKKGKTLISMASWAPQVANVKLTIDWKALRLDPAKAKISAPLVDGFQTAAQYASGSSIAVEPGKGLLLYVQEPVQKTVTGK